MSIKNTVKNFTLILTLLSLPSIFVFIGFLVLDFSVTANLPYSFSGVIAFLVMLSILCVTILWVGFNQLVKHTF